MKKIKRTIGMIMVSFSMISHAVEPIPDPTVEISTPPLGLPGSMLPPLPPPSVNFLGDLIMQGVWIDESGKNNKIFINNGFYRVNDIVADVWKVKSITRKKVVLVHTEAKKIKNINISGK